MILIPEKVNFKISTTNLDVIYSERSCVKIKFEALLLDNYLNADKYSLIELDFRLTAELKCVSMNFSETMYEQYSIFLINEEISDYEFWKLNGYHPNSGFHQVDDSAWLNEKKLLYDPKNRLELKHFLIEGYDSYIELLATDYTINIESDN